MPTSVGLWPLSEPLDEVVWQAWVEKGHVQDRRGSAARVKTVKWVTLAGLVSAAALWPHLAPHGNVVRFIVAAGAIGYRFQQRKGHLREEVQILEVEIDDLKRRRKNIQHHIPVNSLPEPDRFTRLRTERKHFIDTIKMIAYRAESSLASLLREHLSPLDDARALLRQIFQTEADLLPELATNTLTVSLHHLTQAAHDQAIELLLAHLNATQSVFPGTNLTPVFKLASA